ncbi:MAG: hypothetical protein ABSA26_06760 [Thermoguttaceae bacterium]|jgi:hypothetical protein
MAQKKELTTNQKIGAIIGAVVGLVISLSFVNGWKLPFFGDSVEQKIEKFANDTNKILPKQIDAFTRWDRVEAGPGKSYSYVYTLSRKLSDPEKQDITKKVTARALAMPDMQATFAAGVTVWYKYYDDAGNIVLAFPVKK